MLARGFKTYAESLALETRSELGLTAFERLDPQRLAGHLEVPVWPLSNSPRKGEFEAAHLGTLCDEDGSVALSAVTVFDGTRRLIVHNDSHSPGRKPATSVTSCPTRFCCTRLFRPWMSLAAGSGISRSKMRPHTFPEPSSFQARLLAEQGSLNWTRKLWRADMAQVSSWRAGVSTLRVGEQRDRRQELYSYSRSWPARVADHLPDPGQA